MDQKPAWFNNAGAKDVGTYTLRRGRNQAPTVRENHAASRERYTIFTSVCSGWRRHYQLGPAANFPPLCVLFRGKVGGEFSAGSQPTSIAPLG